MRTVEQEVISIEQTSGDAAGVPVGYVPTPTAEYREHRKLMKAASGPALPPAPSPIPIPIPLPGARVLMWKQDPSVGEIGIRKAYLPGHVFDGPRDARIEVKGLASVAANAFADFIQTPGTDAFDAVHTFAVVRETINMYQRARGGAILPWQWNSASNTDPLSVFPHGLPNTQNAFYQRSTKSLKFGDFAKPGAPPGTKVFTCRSFDIVSHETGHAVLDALKPNWLLTGNPPQTGGLHESFGDLTAIFLTLSQMDQCEAVIAQTKANLHDKTFLSDLAEEFGLALGRPNGLRNADNDFKLSQVGTEVHAISQVFTGGIYDFLADIFAFEQRPALRDDARVLYEAGQYVASLVLRGIVAAPASAATFADVVNQMLTISVADGKPVQYRNFLRNRFTLREVVVSPVPLTADHDNKAELAPKIIDAKGAHQDRRACCGTMKLSEYNGGEKAIEDELEQLRKSFEKSKVKAR